MYKGLLQGYIAYVEKKTYLREKTGIVTVTGLIINFFTSVLLNGFHVVGTTCTSYYETLIYTAPYSH